MRWQLWIYFEIFDVEQHTIHQTRESLNWHGVGPLLSVRDDMPANMHHPPSELTAIQSLCPLPAKARQSCSKGYRGAALHPPRPCQDPTCRQHSNERRGGHNLPAHGHQVVAIHFDLVMVNSPLGVKHRDQARVLN